MRLRTIIQIAVLGSTLLVANQRQALAQNTKTQTGETTVSPTLEQHSSNVVAITSAIAGGLLAAYLAYQKGKKAGVALAKEKYNKKFAELERMIDDQHEQAIHLVDKLEEQGRKPPEPSKN